MRILAILGLCIFSACLGAAYADRLPGYSNEAEKQIFELKTEMAGKVEILGEKTVELHDKLKRCLNEKFECNCGGVK